LFLVVLLFGNVRCVGLKSEQLRVLKIMNEVTRRMDLNEFARMVDLDVNGALECIQELARLGFLKKSGGGYGITEKGKAVLTAQSRVADGLEFRFYTSVGEPTGASAWSLKEFYEAIRTIDAGSLEFHLYREDFTNWVQDVVGDEVLATELENVRQSELRGESLRKRLAAAIEKRYDAEALR
jgi:predicted transcriptional regulator